MLGFLGGTFDPVHCGHLHAARTVCHALGLDAVHLVLAARPALRDAPVANPEHRWTMLQLAVRGEPELVADDSELWRPGPSYTVQTLEQARRQLGPDRPLCWILAWDALLQLDRWYRWRRLFELAHLVVLQRPGATGDVPPVLADVLARRLAAQPEALAQAPAGAVYRLSAAMLPISATAIRAALSAGDEVGHLLPEAVSTYINQHQLYQLHRGTAHR